MRYPNDVNIFEGGITDHNAVANNEDDNNDKKLAFKFISNDRHEHYDDSTSKTTEQDT